MEKATMLPFNDIISQPGLEAIVQTISLGESTSRAFRARYGMASAEVRSIPIGHTVHR